MRSLIPVALLALLGGGFLAVMNLWFGNLNQDEGWYLYAALQVADGRFPYVDFAYTQAPLLPLVYSAAAPVIDAMGVGGGRLITLVLGLAAGCGAVWFAARRAGRAAGVVALSLVLLNVYQSYYTTVVKTYSLCAFLLIVSFLLLGEGVRRERRAWAWFAGAAAFGAMAACTRLSSGAVLAVCGLGLLIRAFRGRGSHADWLAYGAAGFAVLGVILWPLYMKAPDAFLFGMFDYHAERSAGGLVSALVYKVGFVSRLLQAYLVAFLLFAAAVLFKLTGWAGRPLEGKASLASTVESLAWWSLGAVTLVHVLAPFPYDDYQVPLFPLFAALLAVWLVRLIQSAVDDGSKAVRWLAWTVLLGSGAAAISSPINQEWMIDGRDRIWWRLKKQPALVQLQDAARTLRELPHDGQLLTQDIYLAVEAGLNVPEGMEMGPFSYYPDADDATAETLHVMNRAMTRELLSTTDIPVAAVSGYTFGIDSPAVDKVPEEERDAWLGLIESRYDLVREIPRFGQAATTLRIYRLRETVNP